MSNVTIELEMLRKWQSKLEQIDGTLSVTEEMYDVISKAELEQKAKQDRQNNFVAELREKEARKLQMRDIVIGQEYRISLDASFKNKFAVLKGSVVRVVSKRRTNVNALIVSDVPGFTGQSFLMHADVLEKL